MKRLLFLSLLSLLLHAGAASVEIYPASRLVDKAVRCVGGEINRAMFFISAGNPCAHKISDFTAEGGPLTIRIFWPKTVEFIGMDARRSPQKFVSAKPMRGEGEYDVYEYSFPESLVQERLVKNKNFLDMVVWFEAPEKLESAFRWELVRDGIVLASENNLLVSAGTIGNAPLAKDYIVYIAQSGVDLNNLPEPYLSRRIDYYRRLGVDYFECTFSQYPHSKEQLAKFQKMRDAGIKLVGLRAGSLMDLWDKYYLEKNYGSMGLVGAMDEFCEIILTREKKIMEENFLSCMDSFTIDWECAGPTPGYDDLPTIAAFAKANDIQEELTPQVLKSKYERAYRDFRQEQACRPIAAQRKIIGNRVFTCAHGSGLPVVDLDYKMIEPHVDYILPMIYTGSMIDFYQRIEAMAEYIPRSKVMPAAEFGFAAGPLNYRTLNEYIMIFAAPAMIGCPGIAHWPGFFEMDGAMQLAAHHAKELLAPFLRFFREGSEAPEMSVRGLPYSEKYLQVGSRKIDLSVPQWKTLSIIRNRKLGNEYAVGILNISKDKKMFAEVKVNELQGKYFLVNTQNKVYMDFQNGALLPVEKNTPAFWLLTANVDAFAGMEKISQSEIMAEFTALRKNSGQETDLVQLGKKGDIEITYEEVGKLACLSVLTADSRIGFSTSGGRIMNWRVNGGASLIHENPSFGGMCMDMLHYPESGRWSGDQVSEYRLLHCLNDGSKAEIVYEGSMNTALTGCKIRKTYTITPGKQTSVRADIEVINDHEAPETEFSFWMHNTLAMPEADCEYLVLQKNRTFVSTKPYSGYYPNFTLLPEDEKLLDKPSRRRESVFPAFGMYHKQLQAGFKFLIPDDFLMNYRFADKEHTTADIMLKPKKVPHGGLLSASFTIVSYQMPLDRFKQVIAEESKELEITTRGTTGTYEVSGQAITLRKPDEKSDFFEVTLNESYSLEPGENYLLSLELQINDMTAARNLSDPGLVFYVNNFMTGGNTWFMVLGDSGKRNLKIMKPFSADYLIRGEHNKVRFACRLNHVKGEFVLQNISIAKLPKDTEIEPFAQDEDGKIIPGKILRLSTGN